MSLSKMDSMMSESHDTTVILSNTLFQTLLGTRMQRLLLVARYLERRPLGNCLVTRPLLGRLLSECEQLVEFCDAYGARNNSTWSHMRHLLAAMRLFSRVGYILRHIRHSLQFYRLLPVEGDIVVATDDAMLFTSNITLGLAAQIVRESVQHDIPLPTEALEDDAFAEELPLGRLPNNRTRRKVKSAEGTVAHLATSFLNLAAESDLLHSFKNLHPMEYRTAIPDPISEESLRQLEHKFHNLQSLYDTHVSDTDTECLDRDLTYLRGHITMIFHLLEVATHWTHYFERHLLQLSQYEGETDVTNRPIVDGQVLLETLVAYPVTFSSQYLTAAVGLCQRMLARYAEIGEITVPVPNYRGFHVRPSTLVAKICHHYGSEVRMHLGGESYDASAPLNLFRANEYINAMKRRSLAEEIATMKLPDMTVLDHRIFEIVRDIVQSLAANQKIVIYERPLPLEELQPGEGESLSQFVLDEIARLLALGKIDIENKLTVTFVGDRRVLADLEVLAKSGYGEDNFGNNIPLPKQLAYLRR